MIRINKFLLVKQTAKFLGQNNLSNILKRGFLYPAYFSRAPPSCFSHWFHFQRSKSSPQSKYFSANFTKLSYSTLALNEKEEVTMPEKKVFQRLSLDVVPSRYDLRLKPNLKTFVFEGSETIDAEVCIRFFLGGDHIY